MSDRTKERQRHLPAGRKAQLTAYVTEAGQATVSALAKRFGVSIDTIRRDLDQLSDEGAIIRTYGGAMSVSPAPRTDRAVDVRLNLQEDEKQRIAALAAPLVEEGSTVLINGGTTTLALAAALRNHRNLTIVTNNLLIPPALPASDALDLYVIGGAVRTATLATIGPVTFSNAGGGEHEIRCDLAVIGVGAVAADVGYTANNLAEAAMMRDMMARASRVAVLADSSKFGRRMFAQVADLGAADYLVTDATPPGDLLEALVAHEVELITPNTSPDP